MRAASVVVAAVVVVVVVVVGDGASAPRTRDAIAAAAPAAPAASPLITRRRVGGCDLVDESCPDFTGAKPSRSVASPQGLSYRRARRGKRGHACRSDGKLIHVEPRRCRRILTSFCR